MSARRRPSAVLVVAALLAGLGLVYLVVGTGVEPAPEPVGDLPRDEAVALARDRIVSALDGADRADALALLEAAGQIADERERYLAYLGLWQHVRRVSRRAGEPPRLRGILDALAAVARTFRAYDPAHFAIERRD